MPKSKSSAASHALEAQISGSVSELHKKIRDLEAELAQAKLDAEKAIEPVLVADNGLALAEMRKILKNLVVNFHGFFTPVLKDCKKSLSSEARVNLGVFLCGSAVPFIHGDTDEKPNDLDFFFYLPCGAHEYKMSLKAFKSDILSRLFFVLERMISTETEKKPFVDGWTLVGLEDITLLDTGSGMNERQKYLVGNLHWNLVLRSEKDGSQLKVGIMGSFPMMNGKYAFDFAHANDAYSPIFGRMPLTLMAKMNASITLTDKDSLLPAMIAYETKTAWWEMDELKALLEPLKNEVVPTNLSDKAEVMIPQMISSKDHFKRWYNSMSALVYFIMRAKITLKGFQLKGGIPLNRLTEESSICCEETGTFAVEICENGHTMTFAEIFKHVLGCYKNGRSVLCHMCKRRMFVPKIVKADQTIDDAIKARWTGFANPLEMGVGKMSFGEKPEVFKHPFGSVFEAMNQVMDEINADKSKKSGGGGIVHHHHHSHS